MLKAIQEYTASFWDLCSPKEKPCQPSKGLEHIHINEGDLVYGLAKHRARFIDDMKNLHPHNIHLSNLDTLVVNTYLNPFLATGEHCKDRRSELYRKDRTYGQALNEAPQHIYWQDIQTYLEHHPRYSPLEAQSPYFTQIRVGRACKAMIERTTLLGNTILFTLDGIDEHLVMKDKNKYNARERYATGKELRYLYRNRYNPIIQSNVIFIKNRQIANPPWLDAPRIWNRYKPKKVYTPEAELPV